MMLRNVWRYFPQILVHIEAEHHDIAVVLGCLVRLLELAMLRQTWSAPRRPLISRILPSRLAEKAGSAFLGRFPPLVRFFRQLGRLT
jgi:hypothetical protein